jgi:hypothetical protein
LHVDGPVFNFQQGRKFILIRNERDVAENGIEEVCFDCDESCIGDWFVERGKVILCLGIGQFSRIPLEGEAAVGRKYFEPESSE